MKKVYEITEEDLNMLRGFKSAITRIGKQAQMTTNAINNGTMKQIKATTNNQQVIKDMTDKWGTMIEKLVIRTEKRIIKES